MKQIKDITLLEILYLFYFFIMFFAKGLGLYDGQLAYKVIFLIACSSVLLKMFITPYTRKEWIILIFASILVGVVYLICKEKGLLICFITIIAIKGVSLERIFKVGFWSWSFSLTINTIYHIFFLEQSGYKVHEKLSMGHIFRWSLGQTHPNILHISYLVLVVLIIYHLKQKYDWKKFILLMVGNIFFFMYSVSYTGVMIVSLYLVVSLYITYRKNICPIEYGLVEAVLLVCIAISFLPPLFLEHTSTVFYILNKILNNRLYLAYVYLVPENIKLFGNNLAQITDSMYTLDNAYLFAFVIYGIIIFSIMIFLYAKTIHIYIKEEKKYELAIIICFLIAGITEPFLFNTSFKNITLLFVGDCLLNGNVTERTYSIIKNYNKKYKISIINLCPLLQKIEEIWKMKKRRVLGIGLIIGVCSLLISLACVKSPTGYMMPRVHVDIAEKNWIYVEDVNTYREQGYVVYDYGDANTMMQIFEGNIVVVEKIRRCISALVIGSLVGGFVEIILLSMKRE